MQAFYRGLIRGKTRIALAWAFAVLLVLSAREYPTWPGIVVCFLGAVLRFWASGYLRKDTRPAIGGPYAYVRNPLYLGTFLMAAGTAIAIQSLPLFIFFAVAFAGIYHFIILDEEEKLAGIFGAPYQKYRALVPRFFPRIWPLAQEKLAEINPDFSHRKFSTEIAIRNKAHESFAAFAALIGFVWVIAYGWKRFF